MGHPWDVNVPGIFHFLGSHLFVCFSRKKAVPSGKPGSNMPTPKSRGLSTLGYMKHGEAELLYLTLLPLLTILFACLFVYLFRSRVLTFI